MSARGSLWLPLAILLLLAGLSFWIEQSVQLTSSASASAKTDPEGIMENFEALRTDPAGHPQYRLSAKRLKHYTGSKLTEMESPRFTQLDAQAGDVTPRPSRQPFQPMARKSICAATSSVVRAAKPGQSAMTLRYSTLDGLSRA